MLSRAVGESDQLQALGTLVDDDSGDIAHRSWFFYRDHSHMVVAEPEDEWPEAERVQQRGAAAQRSHPAPRADPPPEGASER